VRRRRWQNGWSRLDLGRRRERRDGDGKLELVVGEEEVGETGCSEVRKRCSKRGYNRTRKASDESFGSGCDWEGIARQSR
jgi:hypothetical protein